MLNICRVKFIVVLLLVSYFLMMLILLYKYEFIIFIVNRYLYSVNICNIFILKKLKKIISNKLLFKS